MRSKYRWLVVVIFFLFMLLHQADKLLIGPLTTPIMEAYGINEAQMGTVFTGALVVGAFFYPLWGYLYDRYARPKLLALASFLWGTTTWFSALAPTFGFFVASRASTGIDDSSYPGLYSLLSDYFGPQMRGKVFGLLQVSMPIGYLLGLILSSTLGRTWGWRNLFFLTGGIGVLLAGVILVGVKEVPRGQAEPELADLEQVGTHRFDWHEARQLLRRPSLWLLFAQGFFGTMPWNVLTYWAFRFLETERGYNTDQATMVMAVTVFTLAAGYFFGGFLGDTFFQRTRRGRIIISLIGIVSGALLLFAALSVPLGNPVLFSLLLALTGLFTPFAAPNITATIQDITEPELRSTAQALKSFIEQGGAAAAPLIAGLIAMHSSLTKAILYTCIGTWLLCAALLSFALRTVPEDMEELHETLLFRRTRLARTAHGERLSEIAD